MILTSTVLECLLSSFTTSSRLVLCEAIIFLCIVVKFLPNSFCILTTSLPTSLKDETAMALNTTQLPSIMFAQLAQNVNTVQKIIYKIRSEQQKTARIQKLAINKKSSIFVQSS